MTALAAECRRKRIESAILATLRRAGRAMTASEISQYGRGMGGIRCRDRDEILAALVLSNRVVTGERPNARGPIRVSRVYSLAKPGGAP
jgi:hypothetical protein